MRTIGNGTLFKNTQNPKCLLSFEENTLNQELDSFQMHSLCTWRNYSKTSLVVCIRFKVILISEFTMPSHFLRKQLFIFEDNNFTHLLVCINCNIEPAFPLHYLIHLY